MKKIIIALIIVSILLVSFLAYSAARNPVPDTTISVSADDPEMLAAMNKAQETLSVFINALNAPASRERQLLVKARFIEGDEVEHMWIADLSMQGNSFNGVLADEPVRIKKLKFKQPISVTRDQISDWMIIHDGVAKGSFTTRVLLNRMPPEQRAVQERNMCFKLE